MALGRKDLAGKTGTTNENIDAWFCGFNASQVGVAWIGFDQPKTLGTNETGAVAALPIWITYMQKALKGVPEKPLQTPEGVISVRINADTGLRDDGSSLSEWFYRGISAAWPRRRACAGRGRTHRTGSARPTVLAPTGAMGAERWDIAGIPSFAAVLTVPIPSAGRRRIARASRRWPRSSSPSTASPTGRWPSARPPGN